MFIMILNLIRKRTVVRSCQKVQVVQQSESSKHSIFAIGLVALAECLIKAGESVTVADLVFLDTGNSFGAAFG